MARLISKRVRVLDCNCSNFSTQGTADRFDFCECEVRVEKGKHHSMERPKDSQKYHLSTVFIAAHPNRAYGEGFTGIREKQPVPVGGTRNKFYVTKVETK